MASATNAACGIPAVATPAITSTLGNCCLIPFANVFLIQVLTSGYDKVSLLSQ